MMADSTDDDSPVDDFDVEGTYHEYCKAYEAGDTKRCQELRDQWKAWQGEDSLHETAFGEP
jgi:hypothetical protein